MESRICANLFLALPLQHTDDSRGHQNAKSFLDRPIVNREPMIYQLSLAAPYSLQGLCISIAVRDIILPWNGCRCKRLRELFPTP